MAITLPTLLSRKIYKTGQTRGAENDEIYQNRVSRSNTVLIPYQFWNPDVSFQKQFEKGYIVLIPPEVYYSFSNPKIKLQAQKLKLGENCLIFYETRLDWNLYPPSKYHFTPAKSRRSPLGGQYIARVPATTSLENSASINHGFTSKNLKGAGIRLYEYASLETISRCRLQLEGLFWCCYDSLDIVQKYGMSAKDANAKKSNCIHKCQKKDLLNFDKLKNLRIINQDHNTICPLCLEKLSAEGFFHRVAQAEGREVPDLTVTEINLFHIEELRYGVLNHKPYNLGWGHHFCNIVVKDSGIQRTLEWMKKVIDDNIACGYEI